MEVYSTTEQLCATFSKATTVTTTSCGSLNDILVYEINGELESRVHHLQWGKWITCVGFMKYRIEKVLQTITLNAMCANVCGLAS